ncbi:SHOCT domain-containing protein [Streptomyces sp. NRRL F-5727]|uniref:SHOCT domain-containing protein n=1 Tax=Streptomyces sp. NRRL F-5727 TaxID=1463871 RepID=UPI0004CAD572|nr:SHOCT domain-containing protein [Streptomyces sp. NRRL F-5727]
MMFWYGDGMNGWGWFAMAAGMVLFWGLLITVVVLIFRTLDHASGRPVRRGSPTPEQILGERLARGEIDEEEYRRRLSALRGGEP